MGFKMDTQTREAAAQPGSVWVCGACGKIARDRMHGGLSTGWDESCYMHAVLCKESSIAMVDGRITQAEAV